MESATATRILIPLTQQFSPQGFAYSNNNTNVENNNNKQYFDRSLDCTCNFSSTLIATSAPSHHHQSTRPPLHNNSNPAASNADAEMCCLTWLPQVKAVPSASSAASLSSSGTTNNNNNKPNAPANSNTAQSLVSQDSWLVGVLPNGAIRAVCPTAGTTNLAQIELLPPVPESEIPKNPSGSGKLFGSIANHLVAFQTPKGSVSVASLCNINNNNNNNNAASPSAQQAPPPPLPPPPRGRGTVNPTATLHQQQQQATSKTFNNHRNMISCVSFRGGQLHSMLLECPDSFHQHVLNSGSTQQQQQNYGTNDNNNQRYNNNNNRNQYNNSSSNNSNVPVSTGGINGLKLVNDFSLGKHTAPPSDLFHAIELVQIQYYKMENEQAVSAVMSSSPKNKNVSNNDNAQMQQQQVHSHRHLIFVHCRGKSHASGGSERVSAIACFELDRPGQDSLTIDFNNNNISSTNSQGFLRAVTRIPWTTIGGGAAAATASVSSNNKTGAGMGTAQASSSDAQSPLTMNETSSFFDPSAETTNNSNNNNNNVFSSCSFLVSFSIIGHSTETSSTSSYNSNSKNNTHILIALAHGGVPAVLRIGSVVLPPLQSFASGQFLLSGQHLPVNSKQAIEKMISLPISRGTILLAVLTKDNLVQVFCAAHRGGITSNHNSNNSMMMSPTSSSVNSPSSTSLHSSMRRQRESTHLQNENNIIDQNNNASIDENISIEAQLVHNFLQSRSKQDSSSSASSWPLFTPRTKCPFPPVFMTLVCAVAAPGATADNTVDDLCFLPTVVAAASASSAGSIKKQPLSNLFYDDSDIGSQSLFSSISSVSLVVGLANRLCQIFTILDSSSASTVSELTKLERTEPKTVLIRETNNSMYNFTRLSASGPAFAGENSSQQQDHGGCLLAQSVGHALFVLKPPKKNLIPK